MKVQHSKYISKSLFPTWTMDFVNDIVVAVDEVVESRQGVVGPALVGHTPLRDIYLGRTGITSEYDDQRNQFAMGNFPILQHHWILSRDFYSGASTVASNMLRGPINFRTLMQDEVQNNLFNKGVSEFIQFFEITIQKWIYMSGTHLADHHLVDEEAVNYCRRIISAPRGDVNNTLRQLFFWSYTQGSEIRNLELQKWNGDIRRIINTVIELIRRTFEMEEDKSDFLQLIPHLQNNFTRGTQHRWTWELREHPSYLTLLFALVMIRLPSTNLERDDSLTPVFSRISFIDTENQITNVNLQIYITNGNLKSLFFFIPQQNRVFGIWPNTIQVRDGSGEATYRMNVNYKLNLIRSVIVKLVIPDAVAADGRRIYFEQLFERNAENIYKLIRRRNPFALPDAIDRRTRLYVSLTIYANRSDSLIHIPYVLEGSLSNDTDYDINEFCDEWIRYITEKYITLSDTAGDFSEFFLYFSLVRNPDLPLAEETPYAVDPTDPPRQRMRSALSSSSQLGRQSSSGMVVGAPYVGTKKEKHYLLGSLVNRFSCSNALFRTPERRMNSCLMMSLIRSQLYEFTFDGDKCTNIFITGTNSRQKCDNMYVECVTNFDHIPRQFPFLEKRDGKWFVKMFNAIKEKVNDKFLEGAKDKIEEEFWEMAAEEIWFQMQVFAQREVDYTSVADFGQVFANMFGVCISLYDVEVRCNRVHVITPYEMTPKQLIEKNREILMVHLVFDQGHMHAVNNFASFTKSQGRKDDLRIYNYCPICDKKQSEELRLNKESALAHISKCGMKGDFITSYKDSLEKDLKVQPPQVRKAYRKNFKKNRTEMYYQCIKCSQEVIQETYMEHKCYVMPKKVEMTPESTIYVYDLECAQLIDTMGLYKHECNCLLIRKAYPENENEEMGEYFPSEVLFVEALINDARFQNALFIAHNGGSYDIHFLLRIFERGEIPHTYVPSPTSKHKFIQIHLLEKNIRFIDFMRFIPGSLKNIAEAFEIPVSKGDFPHRFNDGKHDDYIGRIPPIFTQNDYWNLNAARSQKDKTNFLKWFSEQELLYCTCDNECSCSKRKWNFQEEIIKYCRLDVIVLAEIVRHYRAACLNFESTSEKIMNWDVPRLDPLQFMTLPQITMQTLVHGFESFDHPDYDFQGITSFSLRVRGGQCQEAILWIRQQITQRSEQIYYLGNSLREYYDFSLNMSFDGYAPQSRTVFLFLKCSYWGCPRCFHEYHELNWKFPERGMYATDVHDHFESTMMELREIYSEVITIWEHDFNSSFADPFDIESTKLMKLEECFYGGRTEVFQIYANAAKLNSEIHYYDVTSLYPSVYAHHQLPLGTPCHAIGHDIDLSRFHPTHPDRYYGYARISITPLKTDLLGLLPKRDENTGRLFFPVYPMSGCWGTEEIYLAMQNGYQVTNVYEIYYWDKRNRSDKHFAAYVNYFFQLKQEAEGWKKLGGSSEDPADEEKQQIVERLYVQNGHLARIRPEKVRKNAVLRALAKLYLNSLWGKFAQKSAKSQHTTIYGTQQFLQLWNSKDIEQSSCMFREISPGVYKVTYNMKTEFINPVKHGNLFIASKVTETARCVLHQKMLQIGPEKIIYCDTDSIIFIYNQTMGLLTDIGLGKWTNEYPAHIIEHVYALAPKLYSLKLKLKESASYEVIKAKGVQLSLINQEKLLFDCVKPLIENLLTGKNSQFAIPVKNFSIFSNSGNNAIPYGNVYTRYNEKKVRAIITKRIYKMVMEVDWDNCSQIRTYPYGFEI